MIDTVIKHKSNIENARDQIKEQLSEVQPNYKLLDQKRTEIVQQKADSVFKELSIIGGFYGKGEKNFVYTVSDLIGRLTAPSYIGYYIVVAIRFWCTMTLRFRGAGQ